MPNRPGTPDGRRARGETLLLAEYYQRIRRHIDWQLDWDAPDDPAAFTILVTDRQGTRVVRQLSGRDAMACLRAAN
ncbi:hypothetical protein [Thiorhodovibrio winogradskyi]|uniref:hypothetical protein n=1 Tax=Thiorhodovibrio winogradskyi TaxID=77007 RepID=UPI002E2DA580|nr:hypothetical protein [Thiorhodovibrio winogradskyi]